MHNKSSQVKSPNFGPGLPLHYQLPDVVHGRQPFSRAAMALALVAYTLASTGHQNCPCVDARHHLPLTTGGCLAPTCNSPLEKAVAGGCVTGSYGSSSCNAWDQEVPECQVSSPPSYCAERWCYVDASQCRLSTTRYERSRYFPDVDGLFYSYATCGGDRTDFNNHVRLNLVSQRTLTFVLPSVSCAHHPAPSLELRLTPTCRTPLPHAVRLAALR